MRVKICGLTREEDIDCAAREGADALGFICGYSDSPRNLSIKKLEQLIKLVPPYATSVVVTPLSNPEIFDIVKNVKPSMLQVSGEGKVIESLQEEMGYDRIIQTVHVGNDPKQTIEQSKRLQRNSKALLLDSKGDGKKTPAIGGTGMVHDWDISRKTVRAMRPFPVILGGGLTPENVASAIRAVGPYAVDVSSGIEKSPGIKSSVKIKRFIHSAKSSFQ